MPAACFPPPRPSWVVAPQDALTAFHHPFVYCEPALEGARKSVTGAID